MLTISNSFKNKGNILKFCTGQNKNEDSQRAGVDVWGATLNFSMVPVRNHVCHC